MAKSSRQTFKKRQRELAKKQKKEDKASRLAARRGDDDPDDKVDEVVMESAPSEDGKPTLKIIAVGGTSSKSDKK